MKSFRPYQIATVYFSVMRLAGVGSVPAYAGCERLLTTRRCPIPHRYGADLQRIKAVLLSSSRLTRPVDQTEVLPVHGLENSDKFPLAN